MEQLLAKGIATDTNSRPGESCPNCDIYTYIHIYKYSATKASRLVASPAGLAINIMIKMDLTKVIGERGHACVNVHDSTGGGWDVSVWRSGRV